MLRDVKIYDASGVDGLLKSSYNFYSGLKKFNLQFHLLYLWYM